MNMKECKDYPRVLIFLVNIINYFSFLLVVFGLFVVYSINSEHRVNMNIASYILPSIIPLIIVVIYNIFYKGLKIKFCSGDISKKAYLLVMFTSIFVVYFLNFISCASMGGL